MTSVARKNIEIVQKIYLAGLAGLVDRAHCTRSCARVSRRDSAELAWKRWEARATRLFFRPSVPCGIPRSPRSRKVTAPWIGSRARIPTAEKLNSSSGLWTSFDSGIGFEPPFASYCFEEERESPARVSQSLSFTRENARVNSLFKIFFTSNGHFERTLLLRACHFKWTIFNNFVYSKNLGIVVRSSKIRDRIAIIQR